MRSVALDLPSSLFADELSETLGDRGLTVDLRSLQSSDPAKTDCVVGLVLSAVPSADVTSQLGDAILRHSQLGPPVICFVPPWEGDSGTDVAALTAYLCAHGAVVVTSPAVFVECILLLAAYGAPKNSSLAIVAPADSWLALAAKHEQRLAERLGERSATFTAKATGETQTVLVDPSALDSVPARGSRLLVPVSGRAMLWGGRPALIGLRHAIAAVEAVGLASERIASRSDEPSTALLPGIDVPRFTRQLDKLTGPVGDHECKVLLSSYKIPITRQAVATTPSAATRVAKKAGFPVQMKAWGDNQPSEREGAIVLGDIYTAADVRRAFASVCASGNCEAVIVRETPVTGRAVHISIRPSKELGLMVYMYQRGYAEPTVAVAPLDAWSAKQMARQVVASRTGDKPPNWDAIADVLLRASHLVSDNPRVLSLDLGRVLIADDGDAVVVVDARAKLAGRR